MKSDAPHSYDGLDRIMHEKARLSILTSLISHPGGLSFNQLKELCDLTDGNLSRHVQVLAEAGLVSVRKRYDGNRPLTSCALTSDGRQRFLDYLNVLEQVLKNAHSGAETASIKVAAGKLKPA